MRDALTSIIILPGFIAVFMIPVCFIIFTKIIVFVFLGKGVGQLKRSMRWIGILCFPAFLSGVSVVFVSMHDYLSWGRGAVHRPHGLGDDGVFVWVLLFGASFSFLFYSADKIHRIRGKEFGNWFYVLWFAFVLATCYAPVLAWPLLSGPN